MAPLAVSRTTVVPDLDEVLIYPTIAAGCCDVVTLP
jgi:hypothetical protein